MEAALKAETRKSDTKSERKGLRAKGNIPAVVYGKKVSNTPIAINEKELTAILRTNPHAIIDMVMPDGSKQPVMINEIQRDPILRTILHVDFHQINMDEPVSTTVRLDFIGDAVGVQMGGILQIQHHEIEIRCLPKQIPNAIEVDVSGLEVGSSILVSDLKVGSSIEIKSMANDVLVTVLAPQKEEAAPDTAEEAEQKAEAKAEADANHPQETV
ncbi:50S ribosomal protein L25/general stress protein Ctc [Paenibacillus doosanensis]|uniref:Large ribosomal subunit protein bL25 n=1 Tax=Paenibacillus konkukensis TaxID=2020716 RepID=A0ABY4RQX4_9BACL|nr:MULTISPECIES: 50S ribosomal protein L25/general stress protein Ctc [Paenibacillus]MCS7463206.1 50S ribosomal protein L25/general stress protein Ctc [Paenibacillus doosanensis]UQZ84906.1 General stress protein CTC [Paenibacillus konkukensis]